MWNFISGNKINLSFIISSSSQACDCKADRLWHRLPLKGIEYLVLPLYTQWLEKSSKIGEHRMLQNHKIRLQRHVVGSISTEVNELFPRFQLSNILRKIIIKQSQYLNTIKIKTAYKPNIWNLYVTNVLETVYFISKPRINTT